MTLKSRHPGGRTCRDGGSRIALLVILAMLRHSTTIWRYVRTGIEPE